ncbi:hypothetical protein HYPSUDRAFT_202858 [Hypholoma sublateritium FD-334 SS-4]|uniref:Uncharacterized protein n=1 Tax=Hypholoma sublateritium (strain FD-334 SS-4) TaxID=945553 RepID=A0A0D2NRT3_HYPSF|nr:hypothetical protein HYPSUDRAFT_202858 [Hypholoma sublateritium FD-334 SS-4]
MRSCRMALDLPMLSSVHGDENIPLHVRNVTGIDLKNALTAREFFAFFGSPMSPITLLTYVQRTRSTHGVRKEELSPEAHAGKGNYVMQGVSERLFMAAATCLTTGSVQDAVVPAVIPFIEERIKDQDGHHHESVITTYGSTLKPLIWLTFSTLPHRHEALPRALSAFHPSQNKCSRRRGISRAKGPADWPHFVRANSVKLLKLARPRAKGRWGQEVQAARLQLMIAPFLMLYMPSLITPPTPVWHLAVTAGERTGTAAAGLRLAPDALILTQGAMTRGLAIDFTIDADRQRRETAITVRTLFMRFATATGDGIATRAIAKAEEALDALSPERLR